MADLALYFDEGGESFEASGFSNGDRYWSARCFMELLGYQTFGSFRKAINRAIGTCTTLGIPIEDNFSQFKNENSEPDYKLSRFACYLVAMNGDVKKPHVAKAQAYFATLAEAARRYMEANDQFERVAIRDDISDREKSLSSAAKGVGVTQYAYFQNAGYRGMYNMDLRKLKKRKGLPDPKRSLLDFMDKRELAGNLFRITETEARLKVEKVRGQKRAEAVAQRVGGKVRDMMIESDGTRPESIPLADDIREVRKGIKATAKQLKSIDKPAKKALKKRPRKKD